MAGRVILFVIFSLLSFTSLMVQGVRFKFASFLDEQVPLKTPETRNLTCTEDMFYEEFPDPSDCRHYFVCLWGSLSREKCPPTTAFHSFYGCIDQSYVKTCGDTYCKHDGIYEDPKNCTRYYLCLLGELHQFTCPEGTIFNRTMITCSKSEDTSCSSGNGTTQVDLNQTTPITILTPATTTTPVPPILIPLPPTKPDPNFNNTHTEVNGVSASQEHNAISPTTVNTNGTTEPTAEPVKRV